MNDGPTSAVHRGALVGSVAARAGALVARLGVALILATLLGVEEAGRYFIFIGVAGLLALFGRFGGDRLALSETSQWPTRSKEIFTTLVRRSVLLSAALALVSVAIVAAIGQSIADGWPALVGIVSVNVVLVAASTMRGRGEIVASVVVGELLAPLLQVAVYVGLGGEDDAFRGLLAYLIAFTATAAVALWFVLRRDEAAAEDAGDLQLGADHARPLLVLGMNGQLRQSFPAIAAGMIGTVADAGAMGAAFRIDRALAFPSEAIRLAVAPQLNSAPDDHLSDELTARSVYWGRVAAAIQLPILVAAFVFAEPLFSVLGSGFDVGVTWLRILIIGGVINVLTGPTLQVLLMSVRRRQLATTSTIGSIVLLATVVVLFIPAGVGAVAIALAVSSSVVSLSEWTLIRRELHARVDVVSPGRERR